LPFNAKTMSKENQPVQRPKENVSEGKAPRPVAPPIKPPAPKPPVKK
jgi:hypothetical protein